MARGAGLPCKPPGPVSTASSSGGEPTLQAALPAALAPRPGFQTALHTGGMYPERLQALLPLLDWGPDIKGPLHAYDVITRTPAAAPKPCIAPPPARQRRHVECCTTWHAGLFSEDDLFALADTVGRDGRGPLALQE